jgi:hypothetical protein
MSGNVRMSGTRLRGTAARTQPVGYRLVVVGKRPQFWDKGETDDPRARFRAAKQRRDGGWTAELSTVKQ